MKLAMWRTEYTVRRVGASVSAAVSLIVTVGLIDLALLTTSDFSLNWQSERPAGVADALLQRRRQAQELFYGFAWSGLAVIIIGVLMPASGAFVTYHLKHATSRPEVAQYLALRAGTLRVIDLQQVQGLVWFPSFHAVLAGLYVYVARGLPWLFWPLLLLNLMMLIACPVLGGHYWTDLPAGLMVLAGVLLILRKFENR